MALQFFGFEKSLDHPSVSGFCQKLESFFRVCNLEDYRVCFSNPSGAPKGKLPYITVGGQTVADSHFIIKYLVKNKIVADLDANLTPLQKAETRAWQAYIEELVYPAIGHIRLSIPSNRAATRDEALGSLPAFIRPVVMWLIARRVRTALRGHGVGRHNIEEVSSFIEEFVNNLDTRLASQEAAFFHGSKATVIDAVFYGFLTNALGTRGNPQYTAMIPEKPRLRAYVARGTRLWFLEYKNILAMVE